MEIWKPIKNYEDLYEVSNLGRVKSLGRIRIKNGNSKPNIWKSKILKFSSKNSYSRVGLNKNGRQIGCLVHRLVAEHFIPNPENKPYVNHIDGNKSNNNVNNLEWCTSSENMKHAYSILGKKGCNFGRKGNMCKFVCQYDLEGNFIRQWNSSQEIQKELGFKGSNIAACCRGQNKTCENFIWKHEYKPIEHIKQIIKDFNLSINII